MTVVITINLILSMNSKNFLATILKVIFMVMRKELSGECKFIIYGLSPACRQAINEKRQTQKCRFFPIFGYCAELFLIFNK